MKIACISLGCPKNQVDLDVMVHILLSAGHETVADLAEADVILVNTCGFIESAKTEAIENILEACSYKQQNPDLKVIVTGRKQDVHHHVQIDLVLGAAKGNTCNFHKKGYSLSCLSNLRCITSPSLLRNATSPSRRGLGSKGEVSRFAKGSPTRGAVEQMRD